MSGSLSPARATESSSSSPGEGGAAGARPAYPARCEPEQEQAPQAGGEDLNVDEQVRNVDQDQNVQQFHEAGSTQFALQHQHAVRGPSVLEVKYLQSLVHGQLKEIYKLLLGRVPNSNNKSWIVRAIYNYTGYDRVHVRTDPETQLQTIEVLGLAGVSYPVKVVKPRGRAGKRLREQQLQQQQQEQQGAGEYAQQADASMQLPPGMPTAVDPLTQAGPSTSDTTSQGLRGQQWQQHHAHVGRQNRLLWPTRVGLHGAEQVLVDRGHQAGRQVHVMADYAASFAVSQGGVVQQMMAQQSGHGFPAVPAMGGGFHHQPQRVPSAPHLSSLYQLPGLSMGPGDATNDSPFAALAQRYQPLERTASQQGELGAPPIPRTSSMLEAVLQPRPGHAPRGELEPGGATTLQEPASASVPAHTAPLWLQSPARQAVSTGAVNYVLHRGPTPGATDPRPHRPFYVAPGGHVQKSFGLHQPPFSNVHSNVHATPAGEPARARSPGTSADARIAYPAGIVVIGTIQNLPPPDREPHASAGTAAPDGPHPDGVGTIPTVAASRQIPLRWDSVPGTPVQVDEALAQHLQNVEELRVGVEGNTDRDDGVGVVLEFNMRLVGDRLLPRNDETPAILRQGTGEQQHHP